MLLVSASAFGEGPEFAPVSAPASPVVVRREAPLAWLGLDLFKADESIRVHLPSLPEGIGFVVRSLDKDGPADEAGLIEYDVVWKLGDQLLVNEVQLATLLRLHRPDETVKLSAFRAGKHIEFEVKLGETPKGSRLFPTDLVDAAMLPNPIGGPIRVVNIAEKTAKYSTEEGTVKVWRDGEGYRVRIDDAEGKLIYAGELAEQGFPEDVPDAWRRRVMALRRGLDHALEGKPFSGRMPRPRVVRPAVKNR